ncbi:MAG: LysE family translocator [Pseudomonadota bacterium]
MEFGVWLSLIGLFFAGGLTPGPAVMLTVSAALRYGTRLALIAALGVSAANLIWIALAASGAATLADAFPRVLQGLKLVGLVFIGWLAWRMATSDPSRPRVSADDAPARAGLFAGGVGLQLANPNALIFFGLLLPAYISPEGSVVAQALIIMATVTATEMLGLTVYAVGADAMMTRFANPVFARRFNIIAATAMFGAAAFAVVTTF